VASVPLENNFYFLFCVLFKTQKHKMSKPYFCTQKINGIECGETNPDKFEKRRRSMCNECKKRYAENYNKIVKETKKLEREKTIEEKIASCKTMEEFAENAVSLFNKIVETNPIKGIGIAIPIKIEEIESKILQNSIKHSTKEIELYKENEALKKENKEIKKEIQELKEQILYIKNNLKL